MAKETAMTEVNVVVPRSGVGKVMTADKTDAIVKRAASGDRGSLPDVQALLADSECGVDFRTACGSSAERLRQSHIKNSAGKNILAHPPSVRLRAPLAILQAADALKVEEIGPTTAEAVQANMEYKQFIDSLG
jgi:hypothetical protein